MEIAIISLLQKMTQKTGRAGVQKKLSHLIVIPLVKKHKMDMPFKKCHQLTLLAWQIPRDARKSNEVDKICVLERLSFEGNIHL